MGEIKHTARFAEIERIFGDYFNSHLAPVMRDTQNYLNRKQTEEMAAYSTSTAGILGSMAAAGNPMMDPYQTLRVTGEWNSKTTEDYLEMCREKIANNKEIQADLALLANEWRTTVVDEIGRERYDELSGQLGCDLAYAYTEYRIGELMMGKMVKDNMPKSSAEYIMRKAAQNTLFGLSYTLNQSPLAAEIERRGEAAYKPSKLEKGTGKVIGAISLGGTGSWASFAKFVGADLAFSALTSSKDKTGNTASVEDCISKGVFGSERNVFDRFRKEAYEIRANDNPYIIATNERLTKKISVQSFDFRDWMSHNAQAKMPFDFIAGQKIKGDTGIFRWSSLRNTWKLICRIWRRKKRLKVNPRLQAIRDNRETSIPHNPSNKPMKRKRQKNQGKIQPLNQNRTDRQDSKTPMPTKTAGAIFSQPWD